MADFNDEQIELIYNNKYEVLTPDGFKPFTGILSGKNELYKVTLSNDMELLATKKHKIIINENRDHRTVEELCVGEAVLTSQGSFLIKNISNVNEIENDMDYKINKNIDVFEFFNIKYNHSYISNHFFCKQCLFLDEFGFIKSHIADEFIASVFPTISSGKTTKVIITSCVTKDTYIYTDKGIEQIQDYIDETKKGGYEINKYKVVGYNGLNKGNIIHNDGLKNTRIITTTYSKLECSLEHKLWVRKKGKEGWVKAKQLSENDYISIKYGMNVWGSDDNIYNNYNITNLTPDICYLIGLCISSTSLCKKYEMIELMESIGFDLKTNIIPKHLLQMSKDNIVSLVQGIFNSNKIATKTKKYICYSFKSIELITQLRMILINLGILTEIPIVKSDMPNILKINKSDLDKIYNNIDIKEDVRWVKINKIESSKNKVYDFSLDDIPSDPWCHSVLYNGMIGHQTPQGMNHFYRMWEDAKGDVSKGNGGNGYERLEIPWNAVPGRDDQWAKEEISRIGQIRFNQEYKCQFIGSVSTLIDHNFLQDLKYKEHMRIPKLPEYVKIWELPRPKAEMEAKEWEYVASLDSGYGMHADNTVLQICLVKSNITIHQVAKMSSNSMDINEFCKKANALLKRYHCPTLIIEQNGPGIAATNFFHNTAEYENLVHFDPKGKHMGLWATERMKDNACVLLKSYVQRGFLHLNDTDTINELYSFGKTASTKFGGMGGTHDDHITSIYWIPYYVNSPLYHGKIVEVNLKTFKEEEGILSTDEERSAEITAYNNLSNLNVYMEEIENASKYLSVKENDDNGLSSTGYDEKKPKKDDDDDDGAVSSALLFRH